MRVAHVGTLSGLRLRRILNTGSSRFPEVFRWSYEAGAGSVMAFLADLLRRHDTAGAVCIDRPEMAARVFMSMVVSGPVRLIVSGNPPSQDEIDERIDFAVRLFLDEARPR